MRKSQVTTAAICAVVAMWGATAPRANAVTSAVKSGDWSDTTTWSNGEPAVGNNSTVDGGFTVTISQPGETTNLADFGTVAGQEGSLSMTGGDLTIPDPTPGGFHGVRFGTAPGATGHFNMTGGTITVEDRDFNLFLIGDPGNGTADISGGTINAGGTFGVAFQPTSTSSVNFGGTAILNASERLNLAANGTTSNATFNMTGGTVNILSHPAPTPQDPAAMFRFADTVVGFVGTATMNMSGGQINNFRDMVLGVAAGSNGTVNQSNGTVVASGADIAEHGTGTYNLTGGTYTANGSRTSGDGIDQNFIVGFDTGSNGLFNQQGGSVTIANSVFLGNFDHSHGAYRISAGTLNVGQNFNVGGPLASNAPPDATRTEPTPTDAEGQAADANGTLTVSGSLGSIHIQGNLLANPADKADLRKTIGGGQDNSATLNFEIANTGISLVNVAGVGDLDGALVDVKLLDGFTPSPGQTFNLITALGGFGATGTGTTQNVGTGEGFILSPDDAGLFTVAVVAGAGNPVADPLVVGTETLQATYVPEPASLGLLAIAGAGLLRRRRRRA